jgi:hypothetical protein
MRILKTAMIAAVLTTVSTATVGGGQMLPASNPSWINQGSAGMTQLQIMQKMEIQKLRVQERQKRLVEDTDKLLALTTALKEQVNESDKNVLSLDMIKKAEEIEKLAHSVKERIKS